MESLLKHQLSGGTLRLETSPSHKQIRKPTRRKKKVVPRLGLEPRTTTNEHSRFVNSGHKYGHSGGILEDSPLGEVIRSWSELSSEIRTAVLAIIKAAGIRKGGAHD